MNQRTIIGTVIAIALPLLFISTHNMAFAEPNQKRAHDGYNNGYDWYFSHPNDGPSVCDPQNLYSSGPDKYGNALSQTYCNTWAQGYEAAQASQPQPQPTTAQEETQNTVQKSGVHVDGNGNTIIVKQGQTTTTDSGNRISGSGNGNGNPYPYP